MSEYPWLKSYPPGVSWDAKLPIMPVQDILADSARKWPDNAAIDFMDRRFTYR